jgi:hypothetical protein
MILEALTKKIDGDDEGGGSRKGSARKMDSRDVDKRMRELEKENELKLQLMK